MACYLGFSIPIRPDAHIRLSLDMINLIIVSCVLPYYGLK